MNNNNSKHQQLLRDRLFLERVFLLEIESCQNTNRTDLTSAPEPQWETDNSNDIRFSDGDTVSAPVPKRTIAPISFVSIYAIVVTLLLLLPSNSERANSKTIAAERENERISLLETKIQQLEAKTQTLSLEVTANYDQKSLPVVETIELVALPIQSTATKLEAIEQEPERGRGADNSTQQTTERLAPLPVPTPPSFTTQSPTQLPPIPVPAPPSFVSQTTSPLTFPPKIVRTVTAINTANLNSSSETESEPKLEIESEVIVSETTVEEKIDKPAEQWLGQTDAVYYSFSFQKDSTSENLAESETSPPNDEDSEQYLTSVPRRSTRQLNASERSVNSDLQPTTEPKQLLLDSKDKKSLAESKLVNAEGGEPQALAEPLGERLTSTSQDEDLARYLSSAPLLDDEFVRQTLGTSLSTERKTQYEVELNEVATLEEAEADKNPESTEQPTEENIIHQSSAIEVERESQARQPLFADEDLRQFLTYTPLFDDATLKAKLKSKQ